MYVATKSLVAILYLIIKIIYISFCFFFLKTKPGPQRVVNQKIITRSLSLHVKISPPLLVDPNQYHY